MKKEENKESTKNFVFKIILIFLLIISLSFNLLLINKNKINKINNDENIVFFGDSMVEIYDLTKFFPQKKTINSGISGNKTEDLIDRIDDIYKTNPSKVFLLIGINDLNDEIEESDILYNYQTIINGLKINRKYSKIYVESIYPVNNEIISENNSSFSNVNNKNIEELNTKLKKLCLENNIIYVNINEKLKDKEGNLKKSYTSDGVHLNNLGYLKVTSIISEYLN